MGMVLSFLSGKGGTGKTTVCAACASALAELGYKVLCIDLDVGLRNLDIALGLSQIPAPDFSELCSADADLSLAASHPIYPNLRFLTAPVGTLPDQVQCTALGSLLQKARKEFDFCLLDAPAGIHEGFRLAASLSGCQILVTGPDPAALRDAARTGELLELMGKHSVRLIVNRVNRKLFRSLDLTVDDIMDTVGYPLVGLIPEDRSVPLAANQDLPLIRFRKSGAAKAARRIARRITGQSVPLSRWK